MQKEILEQPIEGINEDEISQEERDGLIEEKEAWLQGLMDRATGKLNLAYENKLISEGDEERLYNLLSQINEEIASADEDSKGINETLARLDELGNRLKSLEDIKKENLELTLRKYEDAWVNAKKEAANEKSAEIELPHDDTVGHINPERKNRIVKVKIGGGRYGRKKFYPKDRRGTQTPPAL